MFLAVLLLEGVSVSSSFPDLHNVLKGGVVWESIKMFNGAFCGVVSFKDCYHHCMYWFFCLSSILTVTVVWYIMVSYSIVRHATQYSVQYINRHLPSASLTPYPHPTLFLVCRSVASYHLQMVVLEWTVAGWTGPRVSHSGVAQPWRRQGCTGELSTEILASWFNTLHCNLLTMVKRRKLQWYGHVSRSSDIIREWTGLEFAKSQRAVENREKLR